MRNRGSVKYCTLYTVIPIARCNQKRRKTRPSQPSFCRGGRVGRSRKEFAGDTPATTGEGKRLQWQACRRPGDSGLAAKDTDTAFSQAARRRFALLLRL